LEWKTGNNLILRLKESREKKWQDPSWIFYDCKTLLWDSCENYISEPPCFWECGGM